MTVLRRVRATLITLVPRGIRGRLTLLVISAMLPGFILALSATADARRQERSEVQASAYRLARLTAVAHERTLEAARQLLLAITRIPALTDASQAACASELRSILVDTPGFLSAGRAGENGRVDCVALLDVRRDVHDADWFQRTAREGGFTVSGHQRDVVPGRSGVVVAVPFTGAGRRGVLFAVLDARAFSALAADISLPDGTSVNLIDRDGVVVARYPDHDRWVGQDVRFRPIVAIAMAGSNGSAEAEGLEGTVRLFGFHHLEGAGRSGLVLTVGIPRETAFAGANRRLVQSLAFLMGMAVVALVVTWYASERLILHTAERLVRAVRRMAAGDLSVRARVSPGTDELSELSAAFDTMASSLERREAEAQGASESLRALASRTESILEQERTEIAREIHDQLGQNLTALRMDVEWMSNAVSGEVLANPKLDRKLKSMAALLDVTVPLVRNISRRLRPGVLDALGLRAAVEWQLEEFQDRTGIRAELVADLDDSRLEADHATVLFRILQEALTNAIRHARASAITVNLTQDGDRALLEVTDDGVGISERAATDPRALGLLGMRERAQAVGGHFAVAGREGRGTTVSAWLPLKSEDDGAAG